VRERIRAVIGNL